MEGVGVGLGASCPIEEPEPGVVEGRLPGTEEGLTTGVETLDGPGLTESEFEDPPVMVKVGEMLPELPITKFNTALADEGAIRALAYGR